MHRGNICRSPFAFELFSKISNEKGLTDVNADSAGLLALPGNSATHMAQRVASEYEVDLTAHKAKTLSKELLSWSDIILVMEKSQLDTLVTDFPEAKGKTFLMRHFAGTGGKDRGIADPYGFQYEAYRFCYVDIEDAVSGLIKHIVSLQH